MGNTKIFRIPPLKVTEIRRFTHENCGIHSAMNRFRHAVPHSYITKNFRIESSHAVVCIYLTEKFVTNFYIQRRRYQREGNIDRNLDSNVEPDMSMHRRR